MSDTTREDFEAWLAKKPEALRWNTSDAMLAAWTASRQKALQEAAAKVDQKAEGIARVNTYRGRINIASQHAINMLNDAALLIRTLGGITKGEGS